MEKDDLLIDFAEWSGGFSPDECSEEQINAYLTNALPTHFDFGWAEAVLKG